MKINKQFGLGRFVARSVAFVFWSFQKIASIDSAPAKKYNTQHSIQQK